jgi:hypothetical protein
MSTVQIVSSETTLQIDPPLKRAEAFDKVTGQKLVHSMTIYLPREHNNFFFDAIRNEAMSLYGKEGSKTSKFVVSLIKEHLSEKGYFNKDGSPNVKFLKKVKETNER